MYSMCVKGKKESIEEFIKVMQADYDYGTMEFSYDRHFFRVFEANYEEIEQLDLDEYQVIINGYCAWSVSSCMFKSYYYRDLKERYPNEFRGTTLQSESIRLGLDIEVYSEECGCCFQEHYVILNGAVTVEESVDWYEYDLSEFDTKEEAEEELEIEITDEEWNSGEDFIGRGGFGDWDFTI
jgi:hypothetical protein